jgi:hypothetical protein
MDQGGGGGALGTIIYLALVIATIAGLWKVFEKAGKPGWAAIIPIYNLWIWIQICGRQWWWILLFLIPIVSLVIAIILCIDLVKKFGQPGWHALGLIFVGFIYLPWLGFGPATYQG